MRSVLAVMAERIGLLLFISSQYLQHGDALIVSSHSCYPCLFFDPRLSELFNF